MGLFYSPCIVDLVSASVVHLLVLFANQLIANVIVQAAKNVAMTMISHGGLLSIMWIFFFILSYEMWCYDKQLH